MPGTDLACGATPADAHYTSPGTLRPLPTHVLHDLSGKAEWDFACEWECDAGFEKDASGGCKVLDPRP
eukprot:3941121-Rhodomonas_salina.1